MVVAYFHPMRMTYPIQPGPFSRTAPKLRKLPTLSLSRTFRTGRTYLLSAPFIAAEAQHHKESHLIYGPLESTLLDERFPVEHELDACNLPHTQEHLHVASNLCYIDSDAQLRSDIQLPHSWATLSRDFHATLLLQPGPHI